MNENITVRDIGEDGDQWLVTGTTDAHSADEAVRQHIEHTTGQTIEAIQDADDLVEFHIYYSTRWMWIRPNHPGSETWVSLDPKTSPTAFHALAEGTGSDTFAGFLVSA